MGHGHSHQAGWSCRCGPQASVCVCRQCTPVPQKHCLLWDSVVIQTPTLKFWNLRPTGMGKPTVVMTPVCWLYSQSDLGRGFPLCLNGFICNITIKIFISPGLVMVT